MIEKICDLWNAMTGSKVIPDADYVERLFEFFDRDKDGEISLDE